MKRGLRAFMIGRESEDGQAIILVALTLLAMLMMVGVAIDAGQVYSERRAMQEAADAAAYAGTVVLYQGGTQAQAFAAATADATKNGYTNGVNGATVTIQQPTTSPYNSSAYVEVIVLKNVRTSLVPAESTFTSVTVRAISGAESLNNEYALIVLDTGATNNALVLGSGAQISLSGGGIMVNSTGATAANSSTGTWSFACSTSNHCEVDIAGGKTGTWPSASPGSPQYFDGTFTSKPQIADPFAGYPKPSTTGMLTDRAGFGSGSNTLGTGIYTTKPGSTKLLCHGIYIFKAGLGPVGNSTGGSDPVTGDTCDGKVLVFNTISTYPASGGSCGTIDWNGSNTVQLQAMTTGTYKGMLVYQDSACTATMTIGGGGGFQTSSGTIYLPNAQLVASGGSQVAGGQIVAKTMNLSVTVDITFTSGSSAQPVLPRLAK
jgi:Flp pilus assembly protein TadG